MLARAVDSCDSGPDNWLTVGALGGVSLPSFWFGLVLMWVFAGIFGWLRASGTGPATRLEHGIADMIPYFVLGDGLRDAFDPRQPTICWATPARESAG